MVEEIEDYAIVLLDQRDRIVNWNKGDEKIKGYRAPDIIGKSFSLFYPPEARRAKVPEALIAKASKFGKARDEGWRVRKDGNQFWGSIVITALYDNQNKVIGFTKVTRDLTLQKETEDKQLEYVRQLEFQKKELEQYTYIASHDLQEPLRTVSSFVELLTENYLGQLDPEADQYLNYIAEASGRMRQLLKDLLDYSRIGRVQAKVDVDANHLLWEVVADLGASIREADSKIEVGQLPVLKAYPTELKLLFQNLIANALKFRHPDRTPHVSIKASQKPDLWEFTVADNGIGINSKFLQRIFVIFQRLHTRDEYEGAGIGLAHCKKIVGLHGGEIWAESDLNQGSVFHFTLKIQ